MSNDRGQGAPPKGPLVSHTTSSQIVGRPLRGPQSSSIPAGRIVTESRGPASMRPDELAHLYRKIADLQADVAEGEARAVKAERERAATDEMLGQMLARVAEVEARLRFEQKRAESSENGAAQAARLRASQGELQERLQAAEAQNERLRIDLTHSRREAGTHRLAADDQLHLLAKEREETAALRARLDREQQEREALRARIAELDGTAGEHREASTRERDISAKLEQAWVEIRSAHESRSALEAELADARNKLALEIVAATPPARLDLGQGAAEQAISEARADLLKARAAHERAMESLREAHTAELAEALADRARRERAAADTEHDAGRRDLARLEEELAEARRQIERERAAVAEALSLLAGEREWVAELEEDSLRREDELEKARRAQSRADAYARAAETRRVELEDAFAEAERALIAARADVEGLRAEAAAQRARAASLSRERDVGADLIEVDAVPAEIERLRRRVASAEAHAEQMHGELTAALAEVAHLLAELERREQEASRTRTASLASARSLLEHITAATRPRAHPTIEAATAPRGARPEGSSAPSAPPAPTADISPEPEPAAPAPEPALATPEPTLPAPEPAALASDAPEPAVEPPSPPVVPQSTSNRRSRKPKNKAPR